MRRASTYLLPMRLHPRAEHPRTQSLSPRGQNGPSSLFLRAARQKPRMKKPWRLGPTRVRKNTREASPLVQRETLCVAAIRFICACVHHACRDSIERHNFQVAPFNSSDSRPAYSIAKQTSTIRCARHTGVGPSIFLALETIATESVICTSILRERERRGKRCAHDRAASFHRRSHRKRGAQLHNKRGRSRSGKRLGG